jgi:hypothetical protein
MVEAHDFLEWIRAEVCLHCFQILYPEFYPLALGFSSRFLLFCSCPLPLSRPLFLGTCIINSLPESRLMY